MASKRSGRGILSEDFRKLVIRMIVDLGGDSELMTVPRGSFATVARLCGIHKSTVKSIWTQKAVTIKPKRPGKKPKLHHAEMEYIDFLVKVKPSISLGDIQEKLLTFANKTVSRPTICRHLRKKFTRKLLVRPAADRFRDDNLRYMQVFIDVLHRKDVTKIKFFDESGFALPDVSNPRYGRSSKGEHAIQILDNRRTPNKTLNLLLGFEGVCYANILQGPSNTDSFVQFFLDAVNATTNNGDFALKPGDFVVVDNCPIHHGRAEQILSLFLDRLGIEYIFTPVYAPDLNPVELCFQHIKTMFKTEQMRRLAKDNLDYAIMHCVNTVSPADCRGYFKHVGFLRT
ncbi:MAG: transposase [Candidatus Thiodiazotropha endolucinida]|nr:transposase [Candidatus Thiodiazotropha taylori]MCW4249020.1 transposase [Candidatus Thiodiazotropha endolucinida]